MIQPTLNTIPEKKLIGMKVRMSFMNNRTFQLWSTFMPRRKEITAALNNDLVSLSKYDPDFVFNEQHLEREFDKCAAIEVSSQSMIPSGMEPLLIPAGLYAIFHYKGAASKSESFFRYIFSGWLPDSGYTLDNTRPHFEILGDKYKREDPESEEDIWIPVTQVES